MSAGGRDDLAPEIDEVLDDAGRRGRIAAALVGLYLLGCPLDGSATSWRFPPAK
jgi:hypothetical protein